MEMMINRGWLMVEKFIIKQVGGGGEGVVKEKVKDFIQQTLTLKNTTADFFTKKLEKFIIKQVGGGGEEGDVKEKVKDFIEQTLTLIIHFLKNTADFFTKKLDELLPPETRDEALKHLLHVGLTIVLPILLILLFLYCCWRCCCGVSRMMMKVFHCGVSFSRKMMKVFHCGVSFSIKMMRVCHCGVSRKMMKAPGRNGTLMPRSPFEANPKGYFRNLRGKD